MAVALNNLGSSDHLLGRFPEARALLLESLAIFRETGSQRGVAYALSGLGRLATDEGDYEAATDYLVQALAAAVAIREIPKVLDVLADQAALFLKTGAAAQAAELYTLVANHPASSEITQAEAAKRIEQLAAELLPAVLSKAAKVPLLDESIKRLLGQ
jgi:tetratricopeptide (TPR) repeat protein